MKQWLFESDAPMPWRNVAMMLIAIILPAVVAVLFMGRMGAIAFVAALPACLGAQDAGLRVATMVTLTMGFAGMAVLGDPQMALIVSPLLGALLGLCGSFGYAKPAIRGILTWPLFTSPILETDARGQMFAIFILAMLWALAVTHAFGETQSNGKEERERDEYAAVFGLSLGVGLAASVWVGDHYFGNHGFWFPLTFVILVLPPHGQLFSRTLKRTIGTVVGTAAAVALALVTQEMWVLLAVGALCLPLGFRMLPYNYTVFTALLTVAVLEVLALVSDVHQLALERIGTMAAAAALTIGLGFLGWCILRVAAPGALKALQETGDEPADLPGGRRRDSRASATRAG